MSERRVVNDWKSYPVPGGPQMPVPKSRRRIAYTYGALLCSHPGIQAVLPHFLVCSKKRLPQTVAKGFAALPPTRLRLLRRKSSWVTTDCMIRILADVREALQPWLPMVKPILVLDTASPHLPKMVDVFCQKERFSASFCASFQHWPATAARHQCFQCIQALDKKKKPAAAAHRPRR